MPFVPCPLCHQRMSSLFIAAHAAGCGGVLPRNNKEKKKKKKQKKQKELGSLPPIGGVRKQSSSIVATSVSFFRTQAGSAIGVPGLRVFEGVFSSDVQNKLLAGASSAAPTWSDYKYRLAKNYGPAYDLGRRRFLFGATAKWTAFPEYAQRDVIPVLRTLTEELHDFESNQLSVNRYAGAAHILPHNDCENAVIATAVVGVSLGAPCTMTFVLDSIKVDVRLNPGTVYVMAGDALRVWRHAIFPGKTNGCRTSLTFRDVSPHPGEHAAAQS